MPILIEDYVWSQNDESVFVHIPLRGVDSSKVDVFTCNNFIKVNFEKFFCEIFLYKNVIEPESKCLLDEKNVSFELRKEIPEVWPTLQADIPKSEKIKIKEEMIRTKMIQAEELKKEKAKLKQEIRSSATQSQIREDASLREQITVLRKQQEDEFLKSNFDFTNKSDSEDDDTTIIIKKKYKKKRKEVARKSVGSWPPPNPAADVSKIPAPRASGIISVDFTKREFPTPSRETAAEMEQDWLKKQIEAQRQMGIYYQYFLF